MIAATPGFAAVPGSPLPVKPRQNSIPFPQSLPAEADSYTLGPGDRIQIDIFDAPEYSGERGRYQVLVDGTLNLPLLGSISVNGMTLKQAGNLLSERYNRYFKRPFTTVTLIAPRPLVITIAGEVGRPGSYPIALTTQEGGTQFPTLTSALKQAGGITQAANVRQVQVRRPQRVGPDQVLTLDLWQFFQTGDRQQDLRLRDGDSVFVPTADKVDLAESLQLADATFAAEKTEPVSIAVVGEVFRPGSYVVTPNNARTGPAGLPGGTASNSGSGGDRAPTVTRAIQLAGGIKPQADVRNIQVRRLTRAGTEQVVAVDLMKLLRGDVLQDAILQSGDTVIINKADRIITPAEATEIASASFSPDIIRVNVVGEVVQQGTVQVPPNSPLNQALLAAGGFNNRRAHKKSVELIRLNPDGTVTRRDVSIDFTKGINDNTNPTLQNNDIIVVKRSGLTAFTDTLGTVLSPLSTAFPLLNFLRIFGVP
jgi:polysaccharide export outer membrane protein